MEPDDYSVTQGSRLSIDLIWRRLEMWLVYHAPRRFVSWCALRVLFQATATNNVGDSGLTEDSRYMDIVNHWSNIPAKKNSESTVSMEPKKENVYVAPKRAFHCPHCDHEIDISLKTGGGGSAGGSKAGGAGGGARSARPGVPVAMLDSLSEAHDMRHVEPHRPHHIVKCE